MNVVIKCKIKVFCCHFVVSKTVWAVRRRFGKKLDGVGSVDNRPSTDKLHQFVQKKFKKKNTCDM